MGLGAASAAAQYIVTHPQASHNPINLDFLLDPLSKSEFLSFGGGCAVRANEKNGTMFSNYCDDFKSVFYATLRDIIKEN